MTGKARAQVIAGVLLLGLVWLIVYPIALVLLEGLHGPRGGAFASSGCFWSGRPNGRRCGAVSGSRSPVWVSPRRSDCRSPGCLRRYDFPGARVLGAVVALPAVLPPLVGVLAFLFLYGETGFVSLAVQSLFRLSDPPWRLEGAGAVLLVHAYSMYVYFYLFVRAALASLDTSLLEAAASLGAGRWRSFRRVVLPQLYPAIGGAALLTFMTSLGSFSAPYIFGGGFRVMTTQIVATRLNGDNELAMVETISLTLLALVALAVLRGTHAPDAPASGRKGSAPEKVAVTNRGVRLGLAALAWSLAGLLLLPHLTLLLVSFVPAGTWTIEPIPPIYTLRNYVTLLQDPVRARPLVNSLWLATAATIAAVAVALAVGILTVRRRVRGGRFSSRFWVFRGRCRARCSPSPLPRRSACTHPGPGDSSSWGRSGSSPSRISYGIYRSPVVRFWPAFAGSILRSTKPPLRWGPDAGARSGA